MKLDLHLPFMPHCTSILCKLCFNLNHIPTMLFDKHGGIGIVTQFVKG